MLSRGSKVNCRGLGEVSLLEVSCACCACSVSIDDWDLLSALSDVLRSQVGVVTSITLYSLKALASLLSGNVSDLLSLLGNNFVCVLKLLIDQFFVLSVDKWNEEDNAGCEESKAPAREELHKVVAEERCKESLRTRVSWSLRATLEHLPEQYLGCFQRTLFSEPQ